MTIGEQIDTATAMALSEAHEREIEKALNTDRFDQLKFDLLSDEALMVLINGAQAELDSRWHCINLAPLMKCPKCGNTSGEGFSITFRGLGHLTPWPDQDQHQLDYEDDDASDGPSWGAEDYCRCRACDEVGVVGDFLKRTEEGKNHG